MNPPYASSATKSTKVDDKKVGVSDTQLSVQIKNGNWGKSVQNLYGQFFYKIFELNKNNNIDISVFCPPLFLTGESFKEFRNNFFQKFTFEKGFMFSANNFSDVADGWGISFSILPSKK